MKSIRLRAILLDNNEVLFFGRSLGVLTPDEIEQYVTVEEEF